MTCERRAALKAEGWGWARFVLIAILIFAMLEAFSWLRERRPVHTNMRLIAVERIGDTVTGYLIADKTRPCAFVPGSATAYALRAQHPPQWIPMTDDAGRVDEAPSIGIGRGQNIGGFAWNLSSVPDAERIRFYLAYDCGSVIVRGDWPAFTIPEPGGAEHVLDG